MTQRTGLCKESADLSIGLRCPVPVERRLATPCKATIFRLGQPHLLVRTGHSMPLRHPGTLVNRFVPNRVPLGHSGHIAHQYRSDCGLCTQIHVWCEVCTASPLGRCRSCCNPYVGCVLHHCHLRPSGRTCACPMPILCFDPIGQGISRLGFGERSTAGMPTTAHHLTFPPAKDVGSSHKMSPELLLLHGAMPPIAIRKPPLLSPCTIPNGVILELA